MDVWHLSDSSTAALLKLPETGMGFQWVGARLRGESARFLVFNAEVAFDASAVEFLRGDDPSTILANGVRLVELLQKAVQNAAYIVARPEPLDFYLLNERISIERRLLSSVVATGANVVQHSFLPGTYGVPGSEVPFIPTGFAAVGRLALPNVQPASNHYVVEAPAGTLVEFGTVAPAFGQAGGGVEAYFPNGATNQKVPPLPPASIPDE